MALLFRAGIRTNNGNFYYKSDAILKYEKGNYPCGDCDFNGKSLKETIDHCKEKHQYDLADILEQRGIDPEKPEGQSVKKPGKFKFTKAIGWMVPKYDRAQISINLTNYKVTSMHHVLEETRKLAMERGLVVTGSEIVGMVPYPALLETGKFYLKQQHRSIGVPVRDILNTAVQSLGLNDSAHSLSASGSGRMAAGVVFWPRGGEVPRGWLTMSPVLGPADSWRDPKA